MLAVVGPTASGKSDLAIWLCKKYGGEVVSCDSMQIYKRMNIGTAKPTKEEMQEVKHHLIDFLEPGTEYSVSDYVADAEKCVNDLESRGILPVFCGGTGLYIDSFVSGVKFSEFENDPAVRKKLEDEFHDSGIEGIYNRLSIVDPEIAKSVDIHNTKRVIRALEVYETTGITMTEWNKRSKINADKKECLIVGLDYEDRQTLYNRIDMRVDLMLDKGLLEEAKKLYDEGLFNTKTASQAIAYKEFLPYFKGEEGLENCVEVLKRNSRRYAKRQLTWFRRNKDICWIFKDGKTMDDILNEVFVITDQYFSEEI
ncbi:MAG: tRNA (adenosine(37)-N6)-dimethylallyltransferase MiaA [Ruminococcaceae bacterium]|nr:tRNA (adenosine(37)-N6)-dimethylallyltransferase MiaA [Oscillospiraceae bacterium]